MRDIANIDGLTDLPRLLALLASRTGGLLNQADVSRAAGLPYTTLLRYLTLLEATFLVQMLPAWSSNLGLRLVKAPKVTLCDTGLAASLLGLDAERLAQDGTVRGQLLETFVTMGVRKQTGWSRTQPGLFHWRTAGQQEVDLLLENAAGRIVGIEVKASGTAEAVGLQGPAGPGGGDRRPVPARRGAICGEPSGSIRRASARDAPQRPLELRPSGVEGCADCLRRRWKQDWERYRARKSCAHSRSSWQSPVTIQSAQRSGTGTGSAKDPNNPAVDRLSVLCPSL